MIFKNEISALESEFLENRKKVMKLKMESNVALLMKERKIKTSNKPPKKIIINCTGPRPVKSDPCLCLSPPPAVTVPKVFSLIS